MDPSESFQEFMHGWLGSTPPHEATAYTWFGLPESGWSPQDVEQAAGLLLRRLAGYRGQAHAEGELDRVKIIRRLEQRTRDYGRLLLNPKKLALYDRRLRELRYEKYRKEVRKWRDASVSASRHAASASESGKVLPMTDVTPPSKTEVRHFRAWQRRQLARQRLRRTLKTMLIAALAGMLTALIMAWLLNSIL